MVALRKMTREAYCRFKACSIADYAEDLIQGEGLDRQQALHEAEEEFTQTLPDGPETEGQFLMMIEDGQSGREVGWIWFSYEEGEDGAKRVFLSDFLIYTEERRNGYASAALDEMERMAKADGRAESVLYVWEHNAPGYRLYQKCGYKAVGRGENGTHMKKIL